MPECPKCFSVLAHLTLTTAQIGALLDQEVESQKDDLAAAAQLSEDRIQTKLV